MDQALDKDISIKSLFIFSLPTIITMIFMNLYTMIDGVFVSRLIGTDALSSVNIVMPLIITSIAFATMLATGGNALIAKKLGEKNVSEARENFSTIVWTTIIVSFLLSILCFIFIKPILGFLGANESIYKYCYDYATITLIFLPSTMFSIIFQTFFITIGKAHYGLIFTIIGGLSNIVLDYTFIKILNLGISGAAIATGIGYTIPGLLGLLYFVFNRKNSLYLSKPKFKFDFLKDTCINGSSEMVSTLATSIVTLLLNVVLMKMIGVDGVASITVILYIQGLLNATFMGYSMGTAPLISFNYGKGDTNRLRKIYVNSLISISVISVLVFVFSLAKGDLLISIFATKNSEVYAISIQALQLFSFAFLFMGINLFSSSLFTAFSNGKVSAFLSFLRTLVFVVVSILVFPALIGINGVWIAVPIAEFLALIVSIFCLRKFKYKYNYA